MRVFLLSCMLSLTPACGAVSFDWPRNFPSQHFGSSHLEGESWAERRYKWHLSLKEEAPRQFLLLVSVVYPKPWNLFSSEFYVNRFGSVHRWMITPRDTRGHGGVDRQLSPEQLQRFKQLIRRFPVPVRRESGGCVTVSFVENGKWITFVYSAEVLPAVMREIFSVVDFDDYGPVPKRT